MIEGSSLRIIVGTYSALGTLEEMSWKGKKEVQQPEEKPIESGQKHKGHDNSALFSCSQVLPKLAANPAYLHPCGRSSKPLVYYRAPPGLPSTPMCHSLLDPQQMSTQLCLKGRTESEITVCKGEDQCAQRMKKLVRHHEWLYPSKDHFCTAFLRARVCAPGCRRLFKLA